MKSMKPTFCLLLLFFIAACQSQDETPTELETQRHIVSSSDIPEVTSKLLSQLGLRNGGKGFSVYTEGNELGIAIDWDKVKQLIDTTGKQTYTFNVKDQDNDPNTFYNLIFQLSAENEPYQPYLMKYTMDDAFAAAYYSGQADFSNFQGTVKKIRVQGFGNTTSNSYNDDEGGQVLVGESCPGGSQFNNNNNQGTAGSGGVSFGNPPVGGYDPEDDWMCEVYIQETDWWTCVSSAESTHCRITETTYEITYENCGSNSAMSSSDDDGLCQPTDDSIPIIEPDSYCIYWIDMGLNCSDMEVFEQDYKRRMSQKELQIFEQMSELNKAQFLRNAWEAQSYAEKYFPNSVYNGKGDAVRHALFHAMNTVSIGNTLSKQLGDAHEDQNSRYPYEWKEVNMDLHNNQVGREWSNWFERGYYSGINESIIAALEAGELVYLNNLDNNGRATALSVLVKSNN